MISPILLSPSLSSTASISSIDTNHSNNNITSPRIRFAPLPDPRRNEFSDSKLVHDKFVTSHVGEYSPCLDTESFNSDYHSPDPSGSSIQTTDSPTRPSSPETPTLTKSKQKSLKSWKPKSFFKPLLQRASSASVPTTPISSTDSLPSVGLRLFPNSHKDPRRTESDNESGSWGSPLRAWKSAGSPAPPKPSQPPRTPLIRPSSRSRSKSSSVSGLSLPLSTNHVRRGTKMLNGRVYGARRNNENPFANAREEADPAFVEWGHGGMGSVRNGVGGEMWKRLQTENQGVMVGSVENETWGKSVDDGDDGSGMGWVKRRREQREREKREMAEKEREGGVDHIKDDNVQTSPEILGQNSTATLTAHVNSTPESAPISPEKEQEHVLRAVTIPAPPHRLPKTPPHSRGSSSTNVVVAAGSVEKPAAADSREEDDESGDEDEEDEEFNRRTARCAQVEKVSWHKEREAEKS